MTTVTVMWFYYILFSRYYPLDQSQTSFTGNSMVIPKHKFPALQSRFLQSKLTVNLQRIRWHDQLTMFSEQITVVIQIILRIQPVPFHPFSLLASLEHETNPTGSYSLYCITLTRFMDCDAYSILQGLTLRVWEEKYIWCQCKQFRVQKCHSLSTVSVHPHPFSLHWLHCDVWSIRQLTCLIKKLFFP